jgi:pantoate--beta-alanine ligase
VEEVTDVPTVRARMAMARCAGRSIGLIPTMGYLHEGHMRLISRARANDDVVVASVFVNPTQFGPTEDLDRYPRDLNRDRTMARNAGVDILFVPNERAMYPDGPDHQDIWVEPGVLAAHLDGARRPFHFRGVATVVTKLFNIVQPHRAYFGQKDVQQALVIERMVRELAFEVDIVVVPTVRDADDLALSSRNVFLSSEERVEATAIPRALALARTLIADGQRDSGLIVERMQTLISRDAPLARIDFIEVASRATIAPVPRVDNDALVALAVYVGTTRLIDNMIVRFVDGVPHFQ